MTRTDVHVDAMLRHLGAAYYDSLHGRATRADVARALGTVEEQLDEQGRSAPPGPAGRAGRPAGERPAGDGARRRHGWSRRVSDVMTKSVITVDRLTSYKEIAELLARHRISGLPVLKMGRVVAGVVTEDDLLAAQAVTARRLRLAGRRSWRLRRSPRPALTAGDLMTSPAITISLDATITAAARLMHACHARMLPVVDGQGRIVGIVSRRDLLSVFLRPDADIDADIRQVLAELGLDDTGVTVRDGVVTLTEMAAPLAGLQGDIFSLAIRLMWNVDGVVDITEQHTSQQAPPSADWDQT
jgi:CBS domain-containing protein